MFVGGYNIIQIIVASQCDKQQVTLKQMFVSMKPTTYRISSQGIKGIIVIKLVLCSLILIERINSFFYTIIILAKSTNLIVLWSHPST
jgi:hypothetical protein